MRIIACAAELFAADGYARTTLAKIAAAAGVSAETVQGQGPKAALLIAAVEYVAFGVAGEEDVFNLEVGRKLLAIDGRDEAMAYTVALQADVHQRAAALTRALINGASVDHELNRYLNDLMGGVKRQVRRVLTTFRDRGWLRSDVPFDELVETAAVLGSVEVYLRVIDRDGWSTEAYRTWLRRMLAETVLAT